MSSRSTKNIAYLTLLLTALSGCGGGSSSSSNNEITVANTETLDTPAIQFSENNINLLYQKKAFPIPQEDVLATKNDAHFFANNQPEYPLSSILPLFSFNDDIVNSKYTNISLDTVIYYSQGKLIKTDARTFATQQIGTYLGYTQAQTFCGFWESAFKKSISNQHYFIYSVAKEGNNCNTANSGAKFYLASTEDDTSHTPKEINRPIALLDDGWLIMKPDVSGTKSELYRCNLNCSSETFITTLDDGGNTIANPLIVCPSRMT